eukprot:1630134-Lingulodinium_polyedra.AAC.1
MQFVGLKENDRGANGRELSARTIEYAICYDQVQGGELSCCEVVVRRAQLVGLNHRDKVLGT